LLPLPPGPELREYKLALLPTLFKDSKEADELNPDTWFDAPPPPPPKKNGTTSFFTRV
jgi:hypothetical protein